MFRVEKCFRAEKTGWHGAGDWRQGCQQEVTLLAQGKGDKGLDPNLGMEKWAQHGDVLRVKSLRLAPNGVGQVKDKGKI